MFFVVCHNSTAAGNGNGKGTEFQIQSLTKAFCSQIFRWMEMKTKQACMYKFHCAVHSPAGINGKAKFYISDAFYSTTQTITNSHKVAQDLCDRYVYQERSWRFEVQLNREH